jgi:hypothetical protein
MAEQSIYISINDAVAQINSIRQQASGNGTFKSTSKDRLLMELRGHSVMKDIGSGKTWCVPRAELEKILSRERTARFTRSGGFKIVPAPTRGNGKKPGNKPS